MRLREIIWRFLAIEPSSMASNDSNLTIRLLEAVESGDRRALEQLLQRHRPYLKHVVELRLEPKLRQRVDPSDIVQDSLAVAAARLPEFIRERPVSLRIWLRRNAMERLVDARRRHYAKRRDARREFAVTDASSMAITRTLFQEDIVNTLQRKELSNRVRDAINKLSAPDQEIIILRHAENLTNQEAAEAMDIDPGAASKRYGRALGRLSTELRKLGIWSL